MNFYKLAGVHASATRCYRLALQPRVTHLESVAQIPNLGAVRRIVEHVSQPGPTGEKAVLFVHQPHLPPELLASLSTEKYFRAFCQVVGVASDQVELHGNLYHIPERLNDSDATQVYCPGLAVPLPVTHVNLQDSLSFGVAELSNFLGDFFGQAGRIVLLSLRNQHGQYFSASEYYHLIASLVRPLVTTLEPPPIN
jgi:hypothetical protein